MRKSRICNGYFLILIVIFFGGTSKLSVNGIFIPNACQVKCRGIDLQFLTRLRLASAAFGLFDCIVVLLLILFCVGITVLLRRTAAGDAAI